jgi:peroxiredoxin
MIPYQQFVRFLVMIRLSNPSSTLALELLFLACSAGCSKSPDSDVSPAASVSAAKDAPPAASEAASAPPTPPVSHMKDYAAPAAARVGVLAPGTGIAVGQRVPDISALDLDGKQVSLAEFYKEGPILLAFYRGGWCPYCNTEIHALTQAYPEYRKRGVTPVALSVDKPEEGAKLKATYVIPFPVLSDSDAKSLDAFHLAKKLGDEEFAKMKSFGVDLEAFSGKTHHEIAIPALFVIDRTGTVRFAHSDPDFKVRPTTAQILSAIDALKLQP